LPNGRPAMTRLRLNAAAAAVLLLVLAAAAIAAATHAENIIVALLMLASAITTAMIVILNRHAPARTQRPPRTTPASFVPQRFARGERAISDR